MRRFEFRGTLQENISDNELKEALERAKLCVRKMTNEGALLEACLYQYKEMLFLYYEATQDTLKPTDFLGDLTPVMKLWPEADGDTPWAYMYPIFYTSIPDDVNDWLKDRNSSKEKVGRIAFVYEDKLFNYVYWHKALVDEGHLKGDKYQFISLHENILFQHFEEPRTFVSIKGGDEESSVIKGWLDAVPESHFDQNISKGQNFLKIDRIL